MDWTNLTGILTGVLTIFAIVSGGLLGLQRGTMSNLQTRADENSKAAADLRARLSDIGGELAELRATNTQLRNENQLLKDINSGAVNWSAVTDLLDHHHQTAEKHWDRLGEDLTKLTYVLRQVSEETVAERRDMQIIARQVGLVGLGEVGKRGPDWPPHT